MNNYILQKAVISLNKIIICGDYSKIIICNRKGEEVGYTLIDTEDIDKIKNYQWNFGDKRKYVTSRTTGKNIKLHRVILGYFGDMDIDHINRDPTDNRKQNLRIVPATINRHNKEFSGIKQKNGRWFVVFVRFGTRYTSRMFQTKEEAIAAKAKMLKKIKKRSKSLAKEFEKRQGNKATGVCIMPNGKWQACFHRDKINHYVGLFETKDEAIKARTEALLKYEKEKEKMSA